MRRNNAATPESLKTHRSGGVTGGGGGSGGFFMEPHAAQSAVELCLHPSMCAQAWTSACARVRHERTCCCLFCSSQQFEWESVRRSLWWKLLSSQKEK